MTTSTASTSTAILTARAARLEAYSLAFADQLPRDADGFNRADQLAERCRERADQHQHQHQ